MSYATLEDVRKEGVDESVTDEQIQSAIDLATEKMNLLTGRTFEEPIPKLMTRACVLMAIRFYIPSTSEVREMMEELAFSRRVVEETTDGHSYKLNSGVTDAFFTGDTEIDEILSLYRRSIKAVFVGGEMKKPL